METRILQLTDLHLFADADERLKGVPTRQTFADVLQHVDEHEGRFDHVILTGDLTHDERLKTYEAVRALLGEQIDRCRIIPGNHDDRGLIRQVFPDVVGGGEGRLTFSFPAGGWRLIGLDSHVPGSVPGRIDAAQLAWLRDELKAHETEPTALFVHHPPIPVGVAWLDRIGLEEPEELCRLIENSPQVAVVAAGHVHHEFAGRLGNAAVYTAPSTGLQFLPAGDESAYDIQPPGYRVFRFDGETCETRVGRLPEVRFPPIP